MPRASLRNTTSPWRAAGSAADAPLAVGLARPCREQPPTTRAAVIQTPAVASAALIRGEKRSSLLNNVHSHRPAQGEGGDPIVVHGAVKLRSGAAVGADGVEQLEQRSRSLLVGEPCRLQSGLGLVE